MHGEDASAPALAHASHRPLLSFPPPPTPSPRSGLGGGGGGAPLPKRRGILSRIPKDRVGAGFKSSTKIEALLEDLWRCQEEEPGAKALVFSQFVNMLDLIQHRLTHAGVRCVKLDGGMSVAARDRVINAFREDPYVTVFLISLKAGGVALNLTAASRIYLMVRACGGGGGIGARVWQAFVAQECVP